MTKANIKDGVSPVGRNKGKLTATGDISLTGLRPRTEYTLYAVVVASGGQQSAVATKTFTTTAAARSPDGILRPNYTVGEPTQTTIPLTGGSGFSGGADRRRFYVSKTKLGALSVTNAKDGSASGMEGEVWTFTLDGDNVATVTIGSGTPPANKALATDTRYYVRAMDYKSSDGTKSSLSRDLGGTTTNPPPPSRSPFSMPKPVVYAYPNPTSWCFTCACVVRCGKSVQFERD